MSVKLACLAHMAKARTLTQIMGLNPGEVTFIMAKYYPILLWVQKLASLYRLTPGIADHYFNLKYCVNGFKAYKKSSIVTTLARWGMKSTKKI